MLLPEPDGPIIATASPRFRERLTSCNTESDPLRVGYSLATWNAFSDMVLSFKYEGCQSQRAEAVERVLHVGLLVP